MRKICFLITLSILLFLSKVGYVSAQETYFIHSDHLGSTTLITKDGSVVEKSFYYPYGSERSQKLDVGSKITEKTYTGQTSDILDSGLMYYNARYYSPTLAKFTQADSMGDGLNKYYYVHNNPIIMNDPSGNFGSIGAGVPWSGVGAGNIISDSYHLGVESPNCIGIYCLDSKESSGDKKGSSPIDSAITELDILGNIILNQNNILNFSPNFTPDNLLVTYNGELLSDSAIEILKRLILLASEQGYSLVVYSGYRSYSEQVNLYKLNPAGAELAGKSTHQTGIAVDIYILSEIGTLVAPDRKVQELALELGIVHPISKDPPHFIILDSLVPGLTGAMIEMGVDPYDSKYEINSIINYFYDRSGQP